MDRNTREYYRKMAEFREQKFVPEEVGYLGSYYSNLSSQYMQKTEDKENAMFESRQAWNNLLSQAQKARAAGEGVFEYDNTRFATNLFLDEQNNIRNMDDIVKNQQWYSRDKNKFISGAAGKYIDAIKSNELEYEQVSKTYLENQQRYDVYMAELNKRNEERYSKFMEQKQQGLETGQATAYKGATYVEKPR